MRQLLSIATLPLATTGLGLLMWSGMTTAALQMRPDGASTLHQLQWLGLSCGGLLVIASAVARRSMRVPARHDRGRARMLVAAALALAAVLCVLLLGGAWADHGLLLVALGIALLLAAFGSVAALATDLGAGRAPAPWRHPLVLPVQLLWAMTSGLALLYLLMDRLFTTGSDGRTMLLTLTGLGLCLAVCKGVYWHAIGPTRAAPRRARAAVPALLVLGPLLGWLLAGADGMPTVVPLSLATVCVLAAALLDQHLFAREGADAVSASAAGT